MAGNTENDIVDRRAVAAVQQCAVAEEFIWREFTGRDIGIDAVLEQCDQVKGETAGLILLQIKGTRSGKLKITGLKTRHFDYWQTQQLPVVICRVRVHREHSSVYWIDFKGGARAERWGPQRKADSWTLDVKKHRSAYLVRRPNSKKTLREWLNAVRRREADEVVGSTLNATERLLANGRPDEASALLNNIPRWASDQIAESADLKLFRRRAQSLRRAGDVGALRQMLRDSIEAARGNVSLPESRHHGKARAALLQHEISIALWTNAVNADDSRQRNRQFEEALQGIKSSRHQQSSDNSIESLLSRLIGLTALVNITSSWSLFDVSRKIQGAGVLKRTLERFERRVRRMNKSKERTTSQTKEEFSKTIEGYHRNVRNALRALSRCDLATFPSRGNGPARTSVKQLFDYQPQEDETLALADQLLLRAWLERSLSGSTGMEHWTNTKRLLATMHDRLLNGLVKNVDGRLKQIASTSVHR